MKFETSIPYGSGEDDTRGVAIADMNGDGWPDVAVGAPKYYSFVQAGQFVGLLGGMKGAAEYEILIGEPANAVLGMGAQSLVHLLIIAMVILGNVGFFASRRNKRRVTP